MARYLVIDQDTASASFDVPRNADRAYVELTYAGEMEPTLRHDPTSLDKGRMIIHWDANARSLMPGWYWAKVFVNGCECQSFPLRVMGGCEVVFVEQTEYNECYECDGLPKDAPLKCCSTVLKRERCNLEICAPGKDPRPQRYTPDYQEV